MTQHTVNDAEQLALANLVAGKLPAGVSLGGPAAACDINGAAGTITRKTSNIVGINKLSTGRYVITDTTGIPGARKHFSVVPFGATSRTVGADFGGNEAETFIEVRNSTTGVSADDNVRLAIWDVPKS